MKDLEIVNVILASIEIPLHAPTQSIGPTSAIYGGDPVLDNSKFTPSLCVDIHWKHHPKSEISTYEHSNKHLIKNACKISLLFKDVSCWISKAVGIIFIIASWSEFT